MPVAYSPPPTSARSWGGSWAATASPDFSENEMEIWYGPQDRFDVEVRPPGGAWVGPVPLGKAIRNTSSPTGPC